MTRPLYCIREEQQDHRRSGDKYPRVIPYVSSTKHGYKGESQTDNPEQGSSHPEAIPLEV